MPSSPLRTALNNLAVNGKQITRLLTATALLSVSVNANAQSIKPGDLSEFEVVFEVGNNLVTAGSASLLLEKKGSLWNYSLNTKPRGLFRMTGKGRITESSTFTVKETEDSLTLQPQTYLYRQDKERRRAVDASFDWRNNSVYHVYRGNKVTDTFEEPLLDRLTVTLLIMNSLRNGFDRFELPIFDTGRIKTVEFLTGENEELNTRLGKLDTIPVINRNASGGSRETTTWFAPALDYLPVKIEHRKRGDLVARLSLVKMTSKASEIEMGEPMPEEGNGPIETPVK